MGCTWLRGMFLATGIAYAAGECREAPANVPTAPPPEASEWINTLRAADDDLERQSQMRRIISTPASQAAEKLRQLGAPAVPLLTELLDADRAAARANAMWVINGISGDEAQRARLAAFDHPDATVRRLAVSATHAVTDEKVRGALVKVLADADAAVRGTALSRLAFSEREPPTRDQISNYQRSWLIESVGKLAADPDRSVRWHVAHTLGSYHDSNALAVLVRLTTDEDTQVRRGGCEGLGKTGSRRATGALLERLNDREATVVAAAAEALGVLEDPRATMGLVRLLDATDRARPAAATLPGSVRLPATAPIGEKPADEKPASAAPGPPVYDEYAILVARAAAAALGRIRDRRGVEPLIRTLGKGDWYLKRTAAASLGEMGDARAVEPLIARLKPDDDATPSVILALAKLNDSRAIEPIVDVMFAEPDPQDSSVSGAVEMAARDLRHPRMIRALAEHAIRQPNHSSAFIARRTVDRLCDLGYSFDAEGFLRWWEKEAKLPAYAD